MATTASDRQLGFIAKLVAERSDAAGVTDPKLFVDTLSAQRVTGKGASTLIEALLKLPVNATAQAAASFRSNNYAGKCVKCGQQVEVRTGRIEKNAGGRWDTFHLDGQCPAAGTKDKRGVINEACEGLADGHYAVPNWTGSNDLTFILIGTNKGEFNPSLKGHRYVRNVVGGGGDFPVTLGWINEAIEAIKVDPKGAMRLYGQEIGQCGKCHRPLTDETSRREGIGPECRKRGF
jgi:hypothetical protein